MACGWRKRQSTPVVPFGSAPTSPLTPCLHSGPQLFAGFTVVEAAPGGGEEVEEGDELEEGEDEAGVSSPTATGGKKKKRRAKRKSQQGGPEPAEVGVAVVGSPKGAAAVAAPAASSPRQPNSPPAARPSTPPPATASPLTSPRAGVASPRTSQLHVDAPPFTPRSMRARAASASPFGVPEPPSPAAPKSASPTAAQASPKSASPTAAQASPKPASPTAAQASPTAAAAAATPPKPASPKVPTCCPPAALVLPSCFSPAVDVPPSAACTEPARMTLCAAALLHERPCMPTCWPRPHCPSTTCRTAPCQLLLAALLHWAAPQRPLSVLQQQRQPEQPSRSAGSLNTCTPCSMTLLVFQLMCISHITCHASHPPGNIFCSPSLHMLRPVPSLQVSVEKSGHESVAKAKEQIVGKLRCVAGPAMQRDAGWCMQGCTETPPHPGGCFTHMLALLCPSPSAAGAWSTRWARSSSSGPMGLRAASRAPRSWQHQVRSVAAPRHWHLNTCIQAWPSARPRHTSCAPVGCPAGPVSSRCDPPRQLMPLQSLTPRGQGRAWTPTLPCLLSSPCCAAKAWGGVSGGEAAPPVQAVEVKVKPGEKTFGYDELKGEGLAAVGCDVTCPVF